MKKYTKPMFSVTEMTSEERISTCDARKYRTPGEVQPYGEITCKWYTPS